MKRLGFLVLTAVLGAAGCSGTTTEPSDSSADEGAADSLEIDEITSEEDTPAEEDELEIDELEIDEVVDDTEPVEPEPMVDYPEPPAAVDLPILASCLSDAFSRGCAEAPEHTSWACPGGYVPGDGLDFSCIEAADACPDGDYAEIENLETVRYVHPNGTPDGDGSLANPVNTIGAAIELARETGGHVDAILVARGTYAEPVVNDVNTRIIGACASETLLVHEDRG